MISETLAKARAYEQAKDTGIPKASRPGFHLSPRCGWMNDPNGFSEYQGQYHLFYQYHPYTNQWGPMHWGHAVSRDLLHWEHLPAALAPDAPFDNFGCFSGSAITLQDGRQLLMYTGVRREEKADGSCEDFQTQCIAIGDGSNYDKPDCNPVIDVKDIPADFSRYDFRDPKIFREPDGSYACVVGNRTNDGSGAVLLYRSEDGVSWRFGGILERCNNEYGKMWECPDFFPLDGKAVLIVSPQEMHADGLEFHNGNCTLCLIGSYDRAGSRFLRDSAQAVDYGLDFYAPQTLLSADGRRIMIGWMQNWDVYLCPPDAQWYGQMSIPRELSIRDGRLIQMPVRELEAVRSGKVVHENVLLTGEMSLEGVSGRMVDMTVTVTPEDTAPYQMFCMKVAADSRHDTAISYCPATSTLRLSRVRSGINKDVVHERECCVRNRGGEIKLRVILDRYSVEVFVNDGEQVLSAVIYTPQTAGDVRFESCGKACLRVEKYDIVL